MAEIDAGRGQRAGVPFVDRLASWGDAPALVSAGSTVSYRRLAGLVDDAATRLGPTRRLVLLVARPTVETVVAYLGCLRAGHPVLLVDAAARDRWGPVAAHFDPALVLDLDPAAPPATWRTERPLARPVELHPGLRLLLSTSGSTGSAKLVRLSADNLASNAAAIAAYQQLTPADVAVTTLPLGYCFGLSVLHSHLHAGASTVLTDTSVVDPGWPALLARHGVTSVAGVPYTFTLLAESGRPWWQVPSLRFVAQAGGRLEPAEVTRLARLGARHGWRLFVMYGQTEATARMAYLDPDEAAEHPTSIGRPVPGGRLRLARTDADGIGELVYAGPNVMLGYADGPADLARPAELAELATGDLARRDGAGRYHVVGRRSRFAKLLGHRVDLDLLQHRLAAPGVETVCAADDHRLVLATTGEPAALHGRAVEATGLPGRLVVVHQRPELPRLSNGKPDLVAVLALAAEPTTTGAALPDLQRLYAEVLGCAEVPPTASFARLGGDSLSFVELSVGLEERLGRLPVGWPELTLARLAALAVPGPPAVLAVPAEVPDGGAVLDRRAVTPAAAGAAGAGVAGRPWRPGRPGRPGRPRRSAVARMDTGVVLRALAITLVVLVHLKVWEVRGGAHLLLGLAGYGFARFQLAAIREHDAVRGLLRSVARVAVPSVAFIALLTWTSGRGYSWVNVVLANHWVGPPFWDHSWDFWFVEVLVEILLVLAAVFAVPAVRRFERRHAVLLPVLLLGLGLLVRYDVAGLAPDAMPYGRPYAVFWIFALGWLAQRSSTRLLRGLVSLLVVVTLTGYFPAVDDPVRAVVVQTGLLAVLWLPTLPVPRCAVPLLRRVAGASLWVYLTHWVVWPPLLAVGWSRWLVVPACLLAGVAAAALVARVTRLLRRLTAARSVRGPRPTAPGAEPLPSAVAGRPVGV